ncbi:hypothetical protein LTR64_002776 [Lithohypha guttulata]|uniref:uncharacterized protein n=1 Tax=Lithohypha guttulata TaxID=1690604 RepID=UPI002DE13C3D|nr:hypothetical protein LTR51_000999 [Lithohypha guttulata]
MTSALTLVFVNQHLAGTQDFYTSMAVQIRLSGIRQRKLLWQQRYNDLNITYRQPPFAWRISTDQYDIQRDQRCTFHSEWLNIKQQHMLISIRYQCKSSMR